MVPNDSSTLTFVSLSGLVVLGALVACYLAFVRPETSRQPATTGGDPVWCSPLPEPKGKKEATNRNGLTPPEIMAVIRANLNQIRHCYEDLLQKHPDTAGKLGVRFVIGAAGAVTSTCIERRASDLKSKSMRRCVLDRVGAWKFPQPRGGKDVTVNYPFVFNPL